MRKEALGAVLQSALGLGGGAALSGAEFGTGYADPNLSPEGRGSLLGLNALAGLAIGNPAMRRFLFTKIRPTAIKGAPGLYQAVRKPALATMGGAALATTGLPKYVNLVDTVPKFTRQLQQNLEKNPRALEYLTDPSKAIGDIGKNRWQQTLDSEAAQVGGREFGRALGFGGAGILGGGLAGYGLGSGAGHLLAPDDASLAYGPRRRRESVRTLMKVLGGLGGAAVTPFLLAKYLGPMLEKKSAAEPVPPAILKSSADAFAALTRALTIVKSASESDSFSDLAEDETGGSPTAMSKGWQWRYMNRDVESGLEQWAPRMIRSQHTPVRELLASPGKQSLLWGLGGGLAGGIGGNYLGGPSGAGSMGAAMAALGALAGYVQRRRANDKILDAMRYMPPGATMGDWESLEAERKKARESAALPLNPLAAATKTAAAVADDGTAAVARAIATLKAPSLTRQPSPVLDDLLKAKAESDRRNYAAKAMILRKLIKQQPADFAVDSDDGRGILGLTHPKTGFKIHLPQHQLPVPLRRL